MLALKQRDKSNQDKCRVSILLGCNASGTYRLQPFLIHKHKNSRCLAGINKEALPVLYGWNKSAWMTSQLFIWYFYYYFCPTVLRYLESEGLPQKTLLILDNAPCHPKLLNHPQVKVFFMKPNTSVLLQPMDQSPIHSFKCHYLKNLVRNKFLTSDGDLKKFATKEEYAKN